MHDAMTANSASEGRSRAWRGVLFLVGGLIFAASIVAFPRQMLMTVGIASGVYLTIVSVRRVVYTLVAIFTRRPQATAVDVPENTPKVLILVAARDEDATLAECVADLLKTTWPMERLRILVIDDGSATPVENVLGGLTDDPRMEIYRREGARAGRGKSTALRDAVELHGGDAELIYVVDADARVASDSLARLWITMEQRNVDAAQGAMVPRNRTASNAAWHTWLESAVHQGITQTGADRLGGMVSLLGSNYLVKREALDAVGGFEAGVRLEDVNLTLALAEQGRRVAYVPEAQSTMLACEDSRESKAQHRAWSQAFFQAAWRHRATSLNGYGGPVASMDRAVYALGYLDRSMLLVAFSAAFLAYACGFSAYGFGDFHTRDAFVWGGFHGMSTVAPDLIWLEWAVPLGALAIAAAQTPVALWRWGATGRDYLKLFTLPFAFLGEIPTHLRALFDAIAGRANPWRRTRRGVAENDGARRP